MVLHSYFPPDIRIEKEAKILLKSGHKIFLLSLRKEKMLVKELVNGINVIRIFPQKTFLSKIKTIFRFNLFFDRPFWKNALEKVHGTLLVLKLQIHANNFLYFLY